MEGNEAKVMEWIYDYFVMNEIEVDDVFFSFSSHPALAFYMSR